MVSISLYIPQGFYIDLIDNFFYWIYYGIFFEKVQRVVSQASVRAFPGCNEQYPNADEVEGLYVGQDAEGSICDDAGENELNMVNTFDQDNKNHGKGKVFVHLATAGKQEFYSPLGEPDLKDLPSFAHQISQGMVCIQKHVIRRPLISMHAFV